MSYSRDNVKNDVVTILTNNCIDNPLKADLVNDTLKNKLENFGTNILVDNTVESVKNCKIRLDNSINLDTPIHKNTEYEKLLLDILHAEYVEKIGNLDKDTIKILKLSINIYNEASVVDKEQENLKFMDESNKIAIVSDKFLLKRVVRNSDNSLDIQKSANESIKDLISQLLNNTIPFKIAQSRPELDKIIKIILDGNGKNYNFYNNENNIICLSDNIIQKAELLKTIIDSNIQNNYIDLQLFKHKFTNIGLVDRDKFFYLTNIGDGDCLYIAIAKYLYILSHSSRNYPDNNILRKIAEHIRVKSCEYMYTNRFKYIDERGTIEDLVGNSNIWNSNLNNEIRRFENELPNLIERNFNNPTNLSFDSIKKSYSNIDDFTKYCIYMAQHNDKFSAYAGEIEIVSISQMFNKNIFLLGNATDGTLEDGNKKLSHYKVIGGKSIVNNETHLPIFLFLKNSQTGGSHYELLWAKKFGDPPIKEFNNRVMYAEDDNSRWENNVNTLKFIKNDDSNNINNIELPFFNIVDYYIQRASPMIVNILPDSIVKFREGLDDREIIVKTNKDNSNKIINLENIVIRTKDITSISVPIENLDKKEKQDKILKDTSLDIVVADLQTDSDLTTNVISNDIISKYPLENYTKIGNFNYKNKYIFKIGDKLLNINGLNKKYLKKFKVDYNRPLNIIINNNQVVIQNFDSTNLNDTDLLNNLLKEKIIKVNSKTKIKKSTNKFRRRRKR